MEQPNLSRHLTVFIEKYKTMKYKIFIYLLPLLLLFACKDDQISEEPPNNEGTENATAAEISEGMASFGIDLYHQACQKNPDEANVVVSPFSVAAALFMASNGAHGPTREEMLKTLHLESFTMNSINSSFGELSEEIARQDSVTLTSANSVFWDASRITVLDAFSEEMAKHYNVQQQTLDFASPNSLETINDWVAQQTGDKIKDLLKEIKDQDVLFLINALYFKGSWKNQFDTRSTYDQLFTTSEGTEVEVPFMFHDHYFPYHFGGDYTAFDLAFQDTNFTMTFVLPDVDLDFDEFVGQIDMTYLDNLYQNLNTERALLMMPRFDIEFEMTLNDALKDLGIELAFNSGADLSKLGTPLTGPKLFISDVRHKIRLTMDEYGLEGAAATSIGVAVTSAPPIIKLDRPFFYLVRHRENNTILFIGKTGDPSS